MFVILFFFIISKEMAKDGVDVAEEAIEDFKDFSGLTIAIFILC